MSFWDKVKEFLVGPAPKASRFEKPVRDAMLLRATRGERFTALDVADEVTLGNPQRVAADLREASDDARRLFADGLLSAFSYVDDGGAWAPRSRVPAPAAPSAEVRIQRSLLERAGRGDAFDEVEIAAELTRTNAPDFTAVLEKVSTIAALELPSRGYVRVGSRWNKASPAPAAPPAPTHRAPTPAPPRPAPAPSSAPTVNSYEANPEVLGLSPDEFRKRALRINPYRTAWIGRVDTIPPQADERTALIDRGLILRGFLNEAQLAEIHHVGDLWLRFKDADRLAQSMAERSADEALAKLKEAKEKRRAERKAASAARQKARAEAVAQRRATDIIYLGRGVSKELGDRRSNLEALAKLGLPVWSSPADVAQGLGLTIKQLRWLCFHAEAPRRTHYVYFEVPKRSGGKRLLSAPHALLKATQRKVLELILSKVPTEPEAHGFVPGRSTVTNATPHCGQGVVLNLDLKDFFPTVHFRRVRGLFKSIGYSPAAATVLALLCTEAPRRRVKLSGVESWVAVGDRCLPQGAPTSPALANLVSRKLDRRLRGRLGKKGWVYTRYADDLSFSKKSFTRGELGFLHASIRHVITDEGFALNPKKGRALGRGGRQEVTGIVVNVRPGIARDEVRRLRAILHQARKTGLEAQNREKHLAFRSYLEGKIAYVRMVDPVKGLKLKAALDELK